MWWEARRHGMGIEGFRQRDEVAILPISLVGYEHGVRTECKRFGTDAALEHLLLASVRHVRRQAEDIAASPLRCQFTDPLGNAPGQNSPDDYKGSFVWRTTSAAGPEQPKTWREEQALALETRNKEREKKSRIRLAREAKAREIGHQTGKVKQQGEVIDAGLNNLRGLMTKNIGLVANKMRSVGVITGKLYGATEWEKEKFGVKGGASPATKESTEEKLRDFLSRKNHVPEELSDRIVGIYFAKFGTSTSEIEKSLEAKRKVLVKLSVGSEWHAKQRVAEGKMRVIIQKRYSGVRLREEDGAPSKKKKILKTGDKIPKTGDTSTSDERAGTAFGTAGEQGQESANPSRKGKVTIQEVVPKKNGNAKFGGFLKMDALVDHLSDEMKEANDERRKKEQSRNDLLSGKWSGSQKTLGDALVRNEPRTAPPTTAGTATTEGGRSAVSFDTRRSTAASSPTPNSRGRPASIGSTLSGPATPGEKGSSDGESRGGLSRFQSAAAQMIKLSHDDPKSERPDSQATSSKPGTAKSARLSQQKTKGPKTSIIIMKAAKSVIQVPGHMRLLAAVKAFDKDKHSWIEVRSGTYTWEGVLTIDKTITIEGQDGVRLIGRWNFKSLTGTVTIQNVHLIAPEAEIKPNEMRRLMYISTGDLVITDSAIISPNEYAIWVSGRSSLALRGCILAGAEDGSVATLGSVVAKNWSEVDIQDCRFENASESCVFMDDDAVCTLLRCTLQDAEVGVLLCDRAKLVLNESSMRVFTRGALGQMRKSNTEVLISDSTIHGEQWAFGLHPGKYIHRNLTICPSLWVPAPELL
mmetsp:Transcript_7602/g.18336  ORF Transcript_7602/g.18336 Transcript_7602/m.18336 type:complete len:809 (+) Transcript_7602:2-2428(+)